jgi:hypothetical protein
MVSTRTYLGATCSICLGWVTTSLSHGYNLLLLFCVCIGFTEHSGCPVYEGEKKIVTQWIRLGVDEANPWDSFNTLGIKVAEAEEE